MHILVQVEYYVMNAKKMFMTCKYCIAYLMQIIIFLVQIDLNFVKKK